MAGGQSPHHQQAMNFFDQHLAQATHLSAALRQEYQQAAHAVIGQMTDEGARRLNQYVSGYRLFSDVEQLSTYAVPGYSRLPPALRPFYTVNGSYNVSTREVEIDGGGRLGPFVFTTQDRYAHELGHAIDGPGGDVSSTREWVDAWRAEIVPTTRIPNARKDAQEGFASFAAMLYGTNANKAALSQTHPLCTAVWRKHGLW